MYEKLAEVTEEMAVCLTLSDESINQLRKQNLHAGLRKLNELGTELISLMQAIAEGQRQLQGWGVDVDTAYIASVFSGITDAQEAKDYVLLADLLELQLKPLLLQLQETVIANAEIETKSEIWNQNLRTLENEDAILAKQIKQCRTGENLVTEPTSAGWTTLCVTDKTGTYYMHSNVNPVSEGKIFAEQYYSIECSHYVIFGLGLGYHIEAMLQLDDGIYIDIVEPDIEIIKMAFSIRNMAWLTGNPRIRLFYDHTFLKLKELLAQDMQLVIHYPSLRHVEDEEMKLQLEKFFIRDSGMKNFRIQFENNFRDNILNCDGYVDELQQMFAGKNAVIVAAGPSLDKNVEMLRQRPVNTVVVAVGTVFHKLMEMKIRPDFVIFLDAQPHLYKQIEGLERENIPIICASTACKKIAAGYSGKAYLICQNGYDRAEHYAKERRYRLYETGGSVSTIALDMCLQLGCKSVAYIGLDLAFTDNHSHAANTADYAIEDEKDKVMVPAVGGGTVFTRRLFVIYREWIERRVAKEDNRAEVIDATEGGALKKGLRVLTLKDTFALWEMEKDL